MTAVERGNGWSGHCRGGCRDSLHAMRRKLACLIFEAQSPRGAPCGRVPALSSKQKKRPTARGSSGLTAIWLGDFGAGSAEPNVGHRWGGLL
jgi:hypothetical protein